MLTLTVVMTEMFDETTSTFIPGETFKLELEHSLASLSKWESFFEKPFLGDAEKSSEEILWYVRNAMMRTEEVPDEVFNNLTKEHFEEINAYIDRKHTATWFREDPKARPSREVITAEIIYQWMVHYHIWLECENWNLKKLLTLIRVCNQKTEPQKKMSRQEVLAERQRINAQRKAQMGTKG